MGIGPLSDEEASQLHVVVEDAQTECKRTFQEAAPDIAREIVKLAKFGSNERIKLQACNMVLDRALGRVQDTPPKPVNNPYGDMMKEVTALLEANAATEGYVLTDPCGVEDDRPIEPKDVGRIMNDVNTNKIRDIYKDMGD